MNKNKLSHKTEKKFISPNRRTESGPWLLNENKLENLSKVLDEILKTLDEYNDCDNSNNDIANVFVHFRSGKSTKYQSFEEVIKDTDLSEQLITEVEINYIRGYNSLSLNITKSRFSSGIEYKISVKDEKIKDDILFILDGWINKSKPSKIIQIWGNFDLILATLFTIISILIYVSTLKTKQELYSKILERNALELIKNGIDETTQNEAIRIILEYSTKYVPPDFQTEVLTKTNWSIIIILVIIGIVLGFRPKTNLAIGKGKNIVKFWELWMKILFVSIPTSIILPMIINRL